MLWTFDSAPEKLQFMSEHCGDEDWIALVPRLKYDYFGFLEDYRKNISIKELTDDYLKGYEGWVLYICAH